MQVICWNTWLHKMKKCWFTESILQCVRQEVYNGLRILSNADFYRNLVSVPSSAPLNVDNLN